MRFQLKPITLALLLSGVCLPMTVNAEAVVNQKTSFSFISADSSAAATAWKNGDLEQVITTLTNTRLKLNDNASLLMLGEAYEASNEIKKASETYSQLLKRQNITQSEQQYLQLKLALLQEKQAPFERISTKYPQHAENIAKVVNIHIGNVSAMQILSPVENSSTTAQIMKASWLLSSDQFDAAENKAWLAFESADNDNDKHYALALYAEAIRKNRATERALNKLSKYQNDTFLTKLYIDLLLEADNLDKALAVTENSKLPDIQARRAQLLSLTKDKGKLTSYYQQLIIESPSNLQGYYGLAGLLVNQGKISAAEHVFEELGVNNPNNKILLLNAAKRMIAMNMRDKAIQLLTTQIDNAVADPQINYFIFETYLESGEEESAVKILNQLEQHIDEKSPSVFLVAKGYEKLKKPEKALKTLLDYQKHGGDLSYDQQLHLADLAKSAQQNDLAYAQWESLWQNATLPARKHFLERLLVKETQKNNDLKEQIEKLQRALDKGEISLHELNLLVALLHAENNTSDAERVINEYAVHFKIPEKQRLELLAALFGRSREYGKLNDIWSQLAEIDTKNAQQYWQQITLNSLRNNAFKNTIDHGDMSLYEQRLTQVNQLIENLSVSEDSAKPTFIASIYKMAGLPQQAIEYYKKSINNDTDPDALLQLIELYKKEGQIEEAVRLLQFHLISAANNSEFMASIDGLLTLFDTPPGATTEAYPASLRNNTLSWLKRQLLIRLPFTQNDVSLLMILSEVVQSQGEYTTAERINNIILAQSSAQRASLLRSMITQFTGKELGSQSSGPTIGNEQKKLRYGRRLLALQYDFPPALYASLGRSLLADGDIQGAERAFSLMTEIPGILNVKQIKGDAFVSQHLDENALTYFHEALQTEQFNLDLLRKTAILEEQFAQDNTANYWYWQGLKQLIHQTPQYQLSSTMMRTSDTFKYYSTLSEGLMLTLKGSSDNHLLVNELQAMLAKALQNTQVQRKQNLDSDLRDFPRLELITDLMQRIALVEDSWTHWDNALEDIHLKFPNFNSEERLANKVSNDTIKQNADFNALKSLIIQAQKEENFNLYLAVALQKKNWTRVSKIAKDLVKKINTEGEFTPLNGTQYFQLLSQSFEKMPAGTFRDIIWPTLTNIPNLQLLKFQLLQFLPDISDKLENIINTELLSKSEFTAQAITHINTPPIAGMPYSDNQKEFNKLIFKNLNTEELITLWEKIETSYAVSQIAPPIRDELAANILQQTIPITIQPRLSVLLNKYVASGGNSLVPCSAMTQKMMLLDVAVENQTLVIEQANKIAKSSTQCAQLPIFLEYYFAGKSHQAYTAFRALNKDATKGINYQIFGSVIEQYLSKEKQAYIEQFLATSKVSPAQAHDFMNDVVLYENNLNRQQFYLLFLHKQLPKDEIIFNRLTQVLWDTKQLPLLEKVISAWLPEKASSDDLHLLFYLRQLNENETPYSELPNAPSQKGKAISNIDRLVDWLNKSISKNTEKAGVSSLYSQVFTEYSKQFPSNPIVIELAKRQGGGHIVDPDDIIRPDLSRIVEVFNKNHLEGVKQLNTLWRNSIEGGVQFDGERLSREQLLYILYDTKGKALPYSSTQIDFLSSISQVPQTTTLFENWLTALPKEKRSTEQRLYDLIIHGWEKQKVLDEKVEVLLQKLTRPTFTTHDLQLLTTALSHSSSVINKQQYQLLTTRVATMPSVSVYVRLNLANIFSRASYFDTAGQLVLAAVWQMNYPTLTMQNRILASRYNAPKLFDVITQLASWKDKELATYYLNKVLQITQDTINQSKELNNFWRAFVLFAYSELGVPMNSELTDRFDTNLDSHNPQFKIAQVKYLATSMKNNNASTELVLDILKELKSNRKNNTYNRELDTLAGRLYGTHSPLTGSQSLVPWFTYLVKGVSNEWKRLLAKKLSNLPDNEVNPDIKSKIIDIL